MEVKRRTDYAIRMMTRMASTPGAPLSVKVMSQADDVPYQFARAIQRNLSDANLIKVIRGARGGAILARPASEISLLDIVKSTQGRPDCSPCTHDEEWCTRMGSCSVHNIWKRLDVLTAKYLESVKLSDISA